MKQKTQKITALLMAILVVLSTVSFAVTKHYCGTLLVDVALNKEAKSCGMEKPLLSVSCQTEVSQKSCCSDIHEQHQGQEILEFSGYDFGTFFYPAVYGFDWAFLFDFVGPNGDVFKAYSPPWIRQNLQILHSIFRI